ncbi:MAG TPA: hypothetical protein VFJ86_00905 [Usitatibacter sp.]|nr:hypothetical protein [Usitatibacter sp.]
MSNATDASFDPPASQPAIVRAIVPMLVAAGAVSLALAVVQAQPADAPAAPAAPVASQQGTPYSDMHERVQNGPGEAEPLPPTF